MRIWKYLKLSEIIEKMNKEENYSQEEQENNNSQDENKCEQQEQSNDKNKSNEINQSQNENQKSTNSNSQTTKQTNTLNNEQSTTENNDIKEQDVSESISNEEQNNSNPNSSFESKNDNVQEENETNGEGNLQDLNEHDSKNNEKGENSFPEESNDISQNSKVSKNDFQEESLSNDISNNNLQNKFESRKTDLDEDNSKPEELDKNKNVDNKSETTNENKSEELEENSDLEKRKELLQKLRDKLEAYKEKKQKSDQQNEEIKNNFLESLKDLPSFEERSKGNGYSINPEDDREVSEVIIKTLINKFLNQRFTKKQSDLNVRSNSLEKSKGFYKWEIKDVITHLETEQYTKVLSDKYGYDYSHGKDENVPLSFYFDMSGSMTEYSSLLAIIAIELLKKKVKVLVGYNEEVHIQIESIDKNISLQELIYILENTDSCTYTDFDRTKINNKVTYKVINKNIDDYLIEKKAEKVAVFSDFDSIDEVIVLSNHADVYYFCFEKNIYRYKLSGFNGFIYPVQDEIDLERGLVKVNEKRFKSLVYLDNPESVKRR